MYNVLIRTIDFKMNNLNGKGKTNSEIFYRLLIPVLPPALLTYLLTFYATLSTFRKSDAISNLIFNIMIIS